MVKKAIFGGTFDPIHNGHLYIAYEALYKLRLDKIIFMPSGNPPHKANKTVTDSIIRYEMVNMAVKNEERFEVSSFEINKKTPSFTFETLNHFNENEPDVEWYFLTGVDCLMEIETWKKVDKILEMSKFIVFNRSGYCIEDILIQKEKTEMKYGRKIIFLDIPILQISSTDIREKIKLQRNISYFLPDGVYNTIKELQLYR